MIAHRLQLEHIEAYADYFRPEKSTATIEKYLRDVQIFACWLDERKITKKETAAWKAHLAEGYAPASINAMLSALNSLLVFLGFKDCRSKFLKLQRWMFRDDSRDLTRSDYDVIIAAAKARDKLRLALLMEAICATGIRVSEVRYLTAKAVKVGKAEISLKGKIRTILTPNKLCRKLLKYAKQQKKLLARSFSPEVGHPSAAVRSGQRWKGCARWPALRPAKPFPTTSATCSPRPFTGLAKTS